MKALFILFFCLLFGNSFAQWTQVYTHNSSSDNIISMTATNDGGVIAVRSNDFIYSSNYGNTWSLNPFANFGCGTSWQLKSAAIYNKDTFCITGGFNSNTYFGATVSLNGGSNYTCFSNSSTTLNHGYLKPYMNQNGKIFIVTLKGQLFYSTNYGVSFTKIQDIGTATGSSFLNENLGVIIKNNDLFHYDHSTGTLTDLYIPLGTTALDVQMVEDSTVYLVTNNASAGGRNLYKTTDLGQNWQRIFISELSGLNEISKVHFINADTGFVYGNNILLRTTNGGMTWKVRRFNSFTLNEVFFNNVNEGYIAGVKSSASYIYKTTTGGGPWADFNYWYISNAACCANVPCDIFNSTLIAGTFSWLLDGNLVATGISPGTLTIPSGNHTISLVTDNGTEIDTFSKSVYSAPPLPTTTSIYGNPDTTLCYGSVFNMGVQGTIVGYSYTLWEGANMLDGPEMGNGSTRYLTSQGLTDSTLLTVMMQSPYFYCPGNTVSRDINVIVFPNTAEADPFFVDDSICFEDSAYFVIPITNSNYDYLVKRDGTALCGSLNLIVNGNNSVLTTPIIEPRCTDSYYYEVEDTYGCTYNSKRAKLFVDSVHARLYTDKRFGFVGDTIRFNNKSEGDSMFWNFNSGLQQISTNWNHSEFKILQQGRGLVSIILTNTTGCIDSTFQIVEGLTPDTSIIHNFCSSFLTNDSIITPYYGPNLCGSLHHFSKILHIDKAGNSYMAGFSEVGNIDYRNSFITKLDPNGVVIWKKEFNLIGSLGFLLISSIATDSEENVYLTGMLNNGRFNFYGYNYLPWVNSSDPGSSFIMKLNSDGNFQWCDMANLAGAGGTNIISNLKVLDDNRIIVTANSFNSISTYSDSLTEWINPNISNNDGFLFLDSNGFVKKFLSCDAIYENLKTQVEGCANLIGYIPYGMDFAISGDKIIILTMQRIGSSNTYLSFNGTTYVHTPNVSQSEGIGIISIFDTIGNHVRDFEIMRYGDWVPLRDETSNSFMTGIGSGEWDHYGKYQVEPRMEVDSKGNIYATFTPFARLNYLIVEQGILDSIDRFNSGFILPGQGFVRGSHRSNLVVKFDSLGNNLFTLLNTGVVVKDICLSANRQLNLIADYTNFYSLQSTDGYTYGSGDENFASVTSVNGLYFAYDEYGKLLTTNDINGPGLVTTAAINNIDTCNSNVYFAFASQPDTYFEGNLYNENSINYIVKVNNDGNCNDTNICPWPEETTLQVSDEELLFSNWNLFPNPSNEKIGVIYIGIDKNFKTISYSLFNSIGEIIKMESNLNGEEFEVNISTFTDGIYYLCIFDEKGNYIEKLSFVKQ